MIKKNYNYNYFDSIDTEEKAYWLGFIFADGNISKPEKVLKDGTIRKGNYRFEVSLQEEDIDHLNKLRIALNVDKPVIVTHTNNKRHNRCRLYFSNKHLWSTLNSYGCTPKKSLTLKFPPIEIFKDKSLIRHFIRGYIDGDGCISYNNKARDIMSLSILGTEHFLTNLQKNLPLEKANKLFLREGLNVYQLTFNRSRGYYIANYLYNNCTIYLERKYSRYKEFCRLYEESYRSLRSNIGEGCDANSEITTETKKSVAS